MTPCSRMEARQVFKLVWVEVLARLFWIGDDQRYRDLKDTRWRCLCREHINLLNNTRPAVTGRVFEFESQRLEQRIYKHAA